MEQDEIIKEVRAIREAYAEQFGFDVKAIVRDAMEAQKEGGRKLVRLEPKRLPAASATKE